jgi:hypothetical protein
VKKEDAAAWGDRAGCHAATGATPPPLLPEEECCCFARRRCCWKLLALSMLSALTVTAGDQRQGEQQSRAEQSRAVGHRGGGGEEAAHACTQATSERRAVYEQCMTMCACAPCPLFRGVCVRVCGGRTLPSHWPAETAGGHSWGRGGRLLRHATREERSRIRFNDEWRNKGDRKRSAW